MSPRTGGTTRRAGRAAALVSAAAVAVIAWPGPASADTSLGGYSGYAQAVPLRVQIYDPVIPIPSTPEIDGGIGLSRAMTDTGPVSLALASYLWPGDVVGQGFDQLTGDPNSKYPVQVNSRTPATSDAPAHNTAQLTDGNGMTTSSDDTATRATVTGLGVAGKGTDLTGGLGAGLSQLGGSAPPSGTPTASPVPVGPLLAALATVEGVRSESDVVLGEKSVTATARATAGTISLLGGLVSLGSMDARSSTTSDGTSATPSGSVTFGAVTVAGQKFTFGEKGVTFGGKSTKVPATPAALTSLLKGLGIEITPFVSHRSASAATGSLATTGLTVSIDTAPLKRLLNVSAVTDPLAKLIASIPNVGTQISPLLSLGPKIVVLIGDVTTRATSAPAFTGSFPAPAQGGASTSAGGGTTGSGAAGGGAVTGGGGTLGGTGTSGTGGGVTTPTATVPAASTGYDLPPLGAVPKALILGSLVLALAVGWALRNAGGLLFGAGGSCDYGLESGVPDLRERR